MATESRRKKRIWVEFVLDNSNGKFTFPNNNELNWKTVVGITLPDNAGRDVLSTSGRECISNDAVASCHMTLQRDSINMELSVPLKFYQETNGDRSMRPLFIDNFNPGLSFIQFQKDPATNLYRYDTNQSVELIVEYYE